MPAPLSPPPQELFIDLETYGSKDNLTDQQCEYIVKRGGLSRRQTDEDPLDTLALHPLTGCIVAASVYEPTLKLGRVAYLNPGYLVPTPTEPETVSMEGFDAKFFFDMHAAERYIIRSLWSSILTVLAVPGSRILTWNGRLFDIPFLAVRSAINGISPPVDLMGNRFDLEGPHLDVADILFQYGTLTALNFDFTCQQFGLPSPKGDMGGKDVHAAFERKDYRRIANYCARDTISGGRLWVDRIKPTIFSSMLQTSQLKKRRR